MTQNTTSEAVSWHLPRLVTVWVFAALAAVLVCLFVDAQDHYQWLSLAIGTSTLLAFGLQLGTAQREGFISRTAFSVGGAVIVIALVFGVSLLIAG